MSKLESIESTYSQVAQDWNSPITHCGQWFKDSYGRTLLMRGINVCGSSKLPTSPYAGSTHLYDDVLFWDHRNVSFVGRPFPLNEADEHFSRLRAWGLTLIRFLVPWESIEHSGPGLYDEEYIEYLRSLIGLMPKYGLKCVIDPHQDTVSFLLIHFCFLYVQIANIQLYSGLDSLVVPVLLVGHLK